MIMDRQTILAAHYLTSQNTPQWRKVSVVLLTVVANLDHSDVNSGLKSQSLMSIHRADARA